MAFLQKPQMCDGRQRAVSMGQFILIAHLGTFVDTTIPRRWTRIGGVKVETGRYSYPLNESCCPYCQRTLRLTACGD
jgi:hypothetical protein